MSFKYDKVPKGYLAITGAFILAIGIFAFSLAMIVGMAMYESTEFTLGERFGVIAMGLFGYYGIYEGIYRLNSAMNK